MSRSGSLAVLVLALAPATALAQTPSRVERLADPVVAKLVAPRVRADQELKPPVFVGPFGPAPRTILAIIADTAIGPDMGFGGLALFDSAGTWHTIRLPRLAESWQPWDLHAVLFENVDAGPDLEIVVIVTYVSGAGPTGAMPFFHNAVLDWDGRAYVHLPKLERRIETARTAAGVRRALRGMTRAAGHS